MNAHTVTCSNCQAGLPGAALNTPGLTACPVCGIALQVVAFPALTRPMATGKSGEAVLVEGESSCFYHPAKKAAIACERCGRFLCALCDVEWNDQHICPACLEAGRTKGKLKHMETKRFLYDGIALGLATLPMLIFYLTPFTAPIAIYMAIRYWNAPSSVIPRTKARFIIAIILALLQIAGWALLGYFVLKRMGAFGSQHGR